MVECKKATPNEKKLVKRFMLNVPHIIQLYQMRTSYAKIALNMHKISDKKIQFRDKQWI